MFRSVLVPALLLLTVLSCGRRQKGLSENQAYLDEVYYRADSIGTTRHGTVACAFIDSVYAGLPHPSPHDWYRLYLFKRFVYYYLNNTRMQELYCDSMLNVIPEERDDKQRLKDEIGALCIKGDVLVEAKDYKGAFTNYFQARVLSEQTA